MVTKEAIDQAWELLFEAAGVLHESGLDWIDIVSQVKERLDLEDKLMGKARA